MKSFFRLRGLPLFLVLAASVLAGCQTNGPVKDVNMIPISHDAAKKMISQSKDRLDPGSLILASFADIDNLEILPPSAASLHSKLVLYFQVRATKL